MSLKVCISLLLLVIPGLHSVPTDNQPSGPPIEVTEQCDLDLQVTSNEIRGVYESDDLTIKFYAAMQDDKIHATTTTVDSAELVVTASFYFPNTKDRMVLGIEKLVVEYAEEMAESTNCQIPNNLNTVHEQLADKLYQCTTDMGMSQLRFSIMYLETVVASAKRICKGAESICTASPKYTYGEGLFICTEDLEELFPEQVSEVAGNEEMVEVDKEDLDKNEREKRQFYCSFAPRRCRHLRGSSHGCCGNYRGCCLYCHGACYVHDVLCYRCGHWLCGPQCRPG